MSAGPITGGRSRVFPGDRSKGPAIGSVDLVRDLIGRIDMYNLRVRFWANVSFIPSSREGAAAGCKVDKKGPQSTAVAQGRPIRFSECQSAKTIERPESY